MDVVAVQQASGPDAAANRAWVREVIESRAGADDLIVLPEATQMAFGDRPDPLARLAETTDGPFVSMLVELSDAGPAIVAGMFEQSDDPLRPFNTTVVVSGGELLASYRKIHLYDALGFIESAGVTAGEPGGENLVVVEVAGARVGVLTCFDLRFPELSAELVDRGAQVLVLGAAWVPGPRKDEQFRSLLEARAIETTSFVVAAAQPRPRYCGHSAILAPTGEILAEAGTQTEVISASIDVSALESIRASMPVISSRRLRGS